MAALPTFRCLQALLVLPALCLFSSALVAAPRYTFTDLGVGADERSSAAYSINEQGHVVGVSHSASGKSRAMVWVEGRAIKLTEDNDSSATDINNLGQIVGWARPPSGGSSQAVLWNAGVPTWLGGGQTHAAAINDKGLIVGYSNYTDHIHAMVSDATRGQYLNDLGVRTSRAYDINNAGQAVGHADAADRPNRAMLWDVNGPHTLEPLPNASGSEARALNDAGQIVGSSTYASANGRVRATLWQDGRPVDLDPAWAGYSEAFDINDAGQVVGNMGSAVLWENGQRVLLDLVADTSIIEWQFLAAYSINNRGWIVGSARYIGTDTRNPAYGKWSRAFLLKPVPEPLSARP